MVNIEVKLYGDGTIARYELNKPMEIKDAWVFETRMKNGKWADKLGAIGEKGEWVIEIDKENECFKGKKAELEKELGTPEPDQSIYKLEFDENAGLIKPNRPNEQPNKYRRMFWKDGNVRLIKVKSEDDEDDQPSHSPTDTNYRYCFNCQKWKKKSEINEIDWGQQPGGGDGKTYNCDTCKKDLGDSDQTKIFRCKKHHDEILKVWGVMDGSNQEKVFYSQCPQEGQEHDPNKEPSKGLSGGVIAVIAVAVLALISGGAWYWWKQKKERDAEEAEL